MSEYFPQWKSHVVFQRSPSTGCVPTAYEYLLRANGIDGVDFSDFQERFDPQKNNSHAYGVNTLQSIRVLIMSRYRHFKIGYEGFRGSDGFAKVAFLEEKVKNRVPIVACLPVQSSRTTANGIPIVDFHVMPIIDMGDNNFTFFDYLTVEGEYKKKTIAKHQLASLHDNSNNDAANAVAWIEKLA